MRTLLLFSLLVITLICCKKKDSELIVQPNGGLQTLEQTLIKEPSKLWYPNQCLIDNDDGYIKKFNSDHTWEITNPKNWTYSNTTWRTDGHDSQLIVTWAGVNTAGKHEGGIDTIFVKYFTKDSVYISKWSEFNIQTSFNCTAYWNLK